MKFNKKKLILFSIIFAFILAMLSAIYLGSFGLDWTTFYVDLMVSWITWSIILPFILNATT
ncbi:MAG: hypothetical protein AC479_02425 [miscellaneous Crenarchaeota group-6 archaeon AD8-1]|nr:MAG: hypothetical protein AC479_02425 [miscellaneous Crenarchaeota group-6 archaeon AD8-1]